MIITFICGSLENGKDGVGDYTRRLAGQIIRFGHQATIIGIMDKFVDVQKEEVQYDEETAIFVLRIPYSKKYKLNFNLSESWLANKDTEWVSLQYVPFTYNSKGLNFGLISCFKQITNLRKVHVMFHELWVWKRNDYDLKYWLWGRIQKYIITSIKRELHPRLVHTQTTLYKVALERVGYKVELLPLFSNIHFPSNNKNKLQTTIKEKIKINKKVVLVVFGEIQNDAPIDFFSSELSLWGKLNNVSVNIIFIGKNGSNLSQWIDVCKKQGIETINLGWKSREDVAKILTNADIGIATTPYLVIGKSGSVAAMCHFGLPILCVARHWNPKGYENIPKSNFFCYQLGNFDEFIESGFQKSYIKNDLATISGKFISQLLNS